jgi:hypothetical protein
MPTFSELHLQGSPATKAPPSTSNSPGQEDKSAWALEVALDVETAHAMAPGANILLVTTPTAETLGVQGFPQMMAAEQYVVEHHLATVISQSFASAEGAFGSAQSLENLRYAFKSAAHLSLAYTAALWVATVIAVTLTWGSPHSLRSSWSAPWRTARSLYAEIIAVTVGSAAQVVSANAPLTLAPLFLTDAQVGALGLALRVAGFAGTIIISLAAWFGPAFARADSPRELFHLRRQSQYACLALYLPVPIAFLLLPAAVLERISPDLGSVKVLVLILSVGYLVNAATGLAPTLMVMRGWSRSFSAIRVAAAALTVGLLLVGGGLGGAIGLAVASSVAMVGENVWMFVASGRRLQSAASFSVASSGHVGDAGGDPAVR